jgi:hypothetical protein
MPNAAHGQHPHGLFNHQPPALIPVPLSIWAKSVAGVVA